MRPSVLNVDVTMTTGDSAAPAQTESVGASGTEREDSQSPFLQMKTRKVLLPNGTIFVLPAQDEDGMWQPVDKR